MKRILSIALCLCFLLSVAPTALAQTDYTDAVTRVCSMGIMGNTEDGDFRAEDKITRAEFTTVICRMLAYDDIGGQETAFTDVLSSHWASGFISVAYDMGWINGNGDGTFLPEADITYGEAVKILVCMLNYNIGKGEIEFPQGYMSIAASLGMTKNAAGVSEAITRAQTAVLIDNTLDVYPMEIKSNGNIERKDKTLFEILSERKELDHTSGILTSTGNFSIIEKKETDTCVTIDNSMRFYTDKDYDDYLGQYVDIYYRTEDDSVVEISPVQRKNEIAELPAEDTQVNETSIDYYDESGRKRNIRINSETVFLKNGDIVKRENLTPVYCGSYKAVDNDRDGIYEAVLITETESFIVKDVSVENIKGNTVVYFKDDKTYHGKKGFVFKDDDSDNKYYITDNTGANLSFADIEPGSGISLMGNSDESVVKAYISKETCSGKIKSINSENGEITIDNTSYKIARDADGSYAFDAYGMTEGDFVIDAFGYVIGAWEKQNTAFSYAYVENAYIDDSGTVLNVELVDGTEPVQEVKTIDNNRVVSYYLQNAAPRTFEVADKVTFGSNPTNTRGSKISSIKISPSVLKQNIVGYTLDNDGRINKLNVYDVPVSLSSYEFNGDLFSFGGMRVSRGFLKDNHTTVVCVPNVVRSKEDYNVNVKITDGSSYQIYGVLGLSDNEYGSLEANAEPCDIIILKTDMDSTLPANISSDSDICIVGKNVLAADEDGTMRYEIDILNGSNAKTYYVPEGGIAYADGAKLRKGDLIQFSSNAKGEITGIKNRASVQGLRDYTDIDNVYGEVTEIKYDMYDYFNNEMVDVIKVNTGNGITDLKIFKDDGQKVYLYDRKSGYIYPSTTKDILSAGFFGDEASKVFALMKDNDAEAIVVIRD